VLKVRYGNEKYESDLNAPSRVACGFRRTVGRNGNRTKLHVVYAALCRKSRATVETRNNNDNDILLRCQKTSAVAFSVTGRAGILRLSGEAPAADQSPA